MVKAKNILTKISEAGLVGRGGASFPVAKKISAVKDALRTKKTGYIIINGAEGEPGVKKDGYLIQHHGEEVLNGVYLIDHFLGSDKIKHIYFFLNKEYFKNYVPGLKKILSLQKYQNLEKKLKFIVKPEVLTYISGEESALLNLIEGKKVEPRLKPPYPTSHGLFNSPTLINNTETFYNIYLVEKGKFKNERFYTINGAASRRGVFSLSAELTIEEVLKKTNNFPKFPFFVQVGGEAAGEVLRSDQLNQPVEGAGSIMIYDIKRTDEKKLLKYWLNFYHEQSCGNCTICREGTYRLWQIINQKTFDKKLFWDLITALDESSFCALGRSLPIPVKSYFLNIKQTN